MATETQNLDPETIRRLLGTTLSADEAAALRQLEQANLMGKSAMQFNPRMGGGWGGAMGALAQGLQGYQSGSDEKAGNLALKNAAQTRATNRQDWLNLQFPQKRQLPNVPQLPVPQLTEEDDYPDFG